MKRTGRYFHMVYHVLLIGSTWSRRIKYYFSAYSCFNGEIDRSQSSQLSYFHGPSYLPYLYNAHCSLENTAAFQLQRNPLQQHRIYRSELRINVVPVLPSLLEEKKYIERSTTCSQCRELPMPYHNSDIPQGSLSTLKNRPAVGSYNTLYLTSIRKFFILLKLSIHTTINSLGLMFSLFFYI